LVAQAEHAPDATSILLTTSLRFAREVQREVAKQLETLPGTNPARISLKKTGAILLAASEEAAFDFVNHFAPEHLSLPKASATTLGRIWAAGSVFVGPFAAQPLGDYASGSNHVLPTGGWGRSRGGLSAADFVKCISVQTISGNGFHRLAGDVRIFAKAENLPAHENAVAVRQ
jgi:histidinol dehydrogenase